MKTDFAAKIEDFKRQLTAQRNDIDASIDAKAPKPDVDQAPPDIVSQKKRGKVRIIKKFIPLKQEDPPSRALTALEEAPIDIK